MLGLVVMVAAVPEVQGEHATAFVVAYVVLRWFAGRVWGRSQVVLDWPLAQYGVATVPWLVSLWVAAPGRYWLWAGGIVLDALILLASSDRRILRHARRKKDKAVARRGPVSPEGPAHLEPLRADRVHLAERLGLFLIIALGEGLIQVVDALEEVEWDTPVLVSAGLSLVLLVGLWALSLLYGSAGLPDLRPGTMLTRFAMGMHVVLTAAIAALAAGLGSAVADADGSAPGSVRWLLCGGLAVFFAVATIAALAGRRGAGADGLRQVVLDALAVVVLLALGTFGGGLGTVWLVGLLAAVVVAENAARYVELRQLS